MWSKINTTYSAPMNCDICNSDQWIPLGKLVECYICSYTRANNNYFSADMEGLYGANYYAEGDYWNYKQEEKALRINFRNRLSIIRRFVGKGSLLEIGSAYGYFLLEAKTFFTVAGVERNKELAKQTAQALNVSVYGGDILSVHIADSYDALVALDTIEHLVSPIKFLEKCHGLINRGGFLFIETGDIGALLPRIQRGAWRLVQPPQHLCYFSLGTLSQILRLAKFEVIYTKRVTFWRSIPQTFYKLHPHLYKKLSPWVSKLLSKLIFPINTGDLIFVVAKVIK